MKGACNRGEGHASPISSFLYVEFMHQLYLVAEEKGAAETRFERQILFLGQRQTMG